MKNKLNHKGFTVLEAIASIFIISLVLTTSITIIINVRNQTIATNERIIATEVGSRIRDDLINNNTYDEISEWMDGQRVELTSTTCPTLSASLPNLSFCDVFSYISNNRTYDVTMSLVFLVPTMESIQYEVVHFEIIIEYYPHRFITLEGIIYE